MADGFTTVFGIKAANEASGRNWFSKESMEYHGALVETEIIGGYYYVESMYRVAGDPDSGREYRAVRASDDGAVRYLSGVDTFGSVGAARAYITTVIG